MNNLYITGTEFNYYFVCHRKLWLFTHNIDMEQESDNVLLGKLLHENSYKREKKEILIDGMVKIDFLDEEGVHEVKKSNKMEEAHTWQTLYYIYRLMQKGCSVRRGIINYPKQRRTVEVELTTEKEKEIEKTLEKIARIKLLPIPSEVLNSKICKKCSYQEFCFA